MVFTRLVLIALSAVVVAIPQTGFSQITEAQIKATVERAAGYLRAQLQDGRQGDSGRTSLAAYALLSAGDPPTSPPVKTAVANVVRRANSGKYKPGSDGNYGAGVELMLLQAAGGPRYQKEIEAIVNYLIEQQHSSGAWDYPGGYRGGDTSQCQYAMLGFWAAERAGVKVPPSVWDRGAQWFMRTQLAEGGFGYHPLGDRNDEKGVRHTMTAAGIGSLLLARMHLYPGVEDPSQQKPKKPSTTKFGVLEAVDLDTVENPDGSKQADESDYKPTATYGALTAAANRGAVWMTRRFSLTGSQFMLYNFYTVERMAALLNARVIGGHDWFREGAAYLIKSQNPKDGSWKSFTGPLPSTSFGILFLTRTTAKALNRNVPLDPLGNGLLAGGRGLPDDLNQAIMRDGKVETAKELGPIDELLAELEKVESVDVAAAQQAIVEQVTLGDREELIKQKDRLVKLAKHPNVEVRRTAIWALGRTEDLSMGKLLIDALDDNNVDVMVEARNALCTMSRKPLGFNLPESPFEGLPASATEQQRNAAVAQWRKKLKEKWGAWYFKYRPYNERDDLSEALFETR